MHDRPPETFTFLWGRNNVNVLQGAVCEKRGINSTNRKKTNNHFCLASRRSGEVKYQAVSRKDS